MNRTEIILRLVFIDVIQNWFSIFRMIHRRPLGLRHLRSTSVNTEKKLNINNNYYYYLLL